MGGEAFNNYQPSDNSNIEISDDYQNLNISIESNELNIEDYDDNSDESNYNNEDNLFYNNYSYNITPRWTNIISKANALDAEFKYYKNLIPNLIILLANQKDREHIQKWINKLSMPAYNIEQLRDKRNRYMLMICLTLISGNIYGSLNEEPPIGVLCDINDLQKPVVQPFEWEEDIMWTKKFENKKKKHLIFNREIKRCPLHRKACPKDIIINKKIGEFLDIQFQYLLYIYKSYMDKLDECKLIKVTNYIETLCSINSSYCSNAKDIRNKYMIMLYEYLANPILIDEFENGKLSILFEFNDDGYQIFCENDKETADILFDNINCQ